MFAGIIQSTGIVESFEQSDQKAVLFLKSAMFADEQDPIVVGDSISVSGVCLTVVSIKNSVSSFDVSSETLRCIVLKGLKSGLKVNLERALKASARIDGHVVQGHVDATARILSRSTEGETEKFEFSLPEEIRPYVVKKGSIAIDGVSLTIGDVSKESFSTYLIPLTLRETTFGEKKSADLVNLESDVTARYVHRSVELILNKDAQ